MFASSKLKKLIAKAKEESYYYFLGAGIGREVFAIPGYEEKYVMKVPHGFFREEEAPTTYKIEGIDQTCFEMDTYKKIIENDLTGWGAILMAEIYEAIDVDDVPIVIMERLEPFTAITEFLHPLDIAKVRDRLNDTIIIEYYFCQYGKQIASEVANALNIICRIIDPEDITTQNIGVRWKKCGNHELTILDYGLPLNSSYYSRSSYGY